MIYVGLLVEQNQSTFLVAVYTLCPDQSVFSPMKMAYKIELGFSNEWDTGMAIGRRDFLK